MPPRSTDRLRDGRVFSTLGTFGLAAGFAVPAVLLGSTQAGAAPEAPAPAVAGRQSVCGEPEAESFPIETRIHGGPDTYASGGGYGTWYLDLTNTTAETCRAIHPVLVLTDRDRTLGPSRIQLEFSERSDPDTRHRVAWETTERHEQIGVFGSGEDDDFPGFTVPAEHTVTVRIRMAFTSDTPPGPVTANAAIVQRMSGPEQRGGDGDWVGESADYRFTVVEGALDDGTEVETGTDGDGETGTGGDAETGTDGDGETGTGGDGEAGTGRDAPRLDAAGNPLPELARTGREGTATGTGLTAGALLLGGAAALAGARRIRRVR
ncbi:MULTISPECIES: hypothetical protein [Streptomyces]|uniref:hypothetical protein n=1 Tax=Streptomyces TaxID=1883 RepID=UPI0029B34837|nr:hypothetical protein [Streptomyces sp. ND04-05B]MDX3064962.1 hypothetical protein [Streptomyces sp. ND04-05B]